MSVWQFVLRGSSWEIWVLAQTLEIVRYTNTHLREVSVLSHTEVEAWASLTPPGLLLDQATVFANLIANRNYTDLCLYHLKVMITIELFDNFCLLIFFNLFFYLC